MDCARRPGRTLLQASSALNQVNDEDNYGNYEQEMDQTAANVANKAEKPEHDQDNNYSPKNGIPFGSVKLSSAYLSSGLSIHQAFRNIESKQHRDLYVRLRHPCRCRLTQVLSLVVFAARLFGRAPFNG